MIILNLLSYLQLVMLRLVMPNNKKYQDHIVCIYGYKLICVDDQYSKPYKIYFGENAIHKFLIDVIKESEYCSKVIETEVNKPPFIIEKDNEDHEFY